MNKKINSKEIRICYKSCHSNMSLSYLQIDNIVNWMHCRIMWMNFDMIFMYMLGSNGRLNGFDSDSFFAHQIVTFHLNYDKIVSFCWRRERRFLVEAIFIIVIVYFSQVHLRNILWRDRDHEILLFWNRKSRKKSDYNTTWSKEIVFPLLNSFSLMK
jgi:hypothetical protein